jgi:hypothetical protein
MNEILMYYHKSLKVLKCSNKHWTSSQLHVQWWMNSFVSPQNMIVYETWYTCLHCTYTPQPPKELPTLWQSKHMNI